MSLTTADTKKIAQLAKLNLNEEEVALYTTQLSDIFNTISQMSAVNTQGIEPIAHSIELGQRVRPDQVTEINQRDTFQRLAPDVEAGLYLVPKVIETE